jgi:hypothetical protein
MSITKISKPQNKMKNKSLYTYLTGAVLIFSIFLMTPPHSSMAAFAPIVVRTDSIPVYNSLLGWQNRLTHLNYVVNRLRQSDLPSRDVSFMTDSLIAPLMQDIYVQVNKQQADTLKNKSKNR